MKFYLKIWLFLLALLCLSGRALADNTYPKSYQVTEYLRGGKLYLLQPDAGGKEPISFFVQSGWAEDGVIYKWQGCRKEGSSGNSIGRIDVRDAMPLDSALLAVWSDNDTVYAGIIDQNVKFTQSIKLKQISGFERLERTRWIGKIADNKYLLQLTDELYLISIGEEGYLSSKFLKNNVEAAISLMNSGFEKQELAFTISNEASSLVIFIDKDENEKIAARLQRAEMYDMKLVDGKIAVITSSEVNFQSFVHIVDTAGVATNFWVNANANNLAFIRKKEKTKLMALENTDEGYSLTASKLNLTGKTEFIRKVDIPEQFIEPMELKADGGIIYAIFRNGIISFNDEGDIESADFVAVGEKFDIKPELSYQNNHLILTSNTGALILEKKHNTLWVFNRFLENRGKILLPAVLVIVLFVLFRMYRRQKRLLREVLELPGTGVVLVVDKYGRLVNANNPGKKFLGISENVPMRRLFQYYFVSDTTRPIKDIIENALSSKESVHQRVNLMINGDQKEWYCTIVPLRNIAGNYRGLVFTGIDITEQLERKRLSNWAQLAHDMQTNLSTIRLNAESLLPDSEDSNTNRKNRIIQQVNILIQRVRDIVTVGRSNELNREKVNAADICNEIRNEFDPIMFPKVDFELDLRNFNLYCDRAKITRALRNAVENGIKAMNRQEGKITIKCSSDLRNAYFSVKDTGKGMDEKTREKMLKPYFTTSENTGGAGIGTMIMQQVVELHGGDINIDSEPGKGSEITFRLPIAHKTTQRRSFVDNLTGNGK